MTQESQSGSGRTGIKVLIGALVVIVVVVGYFAITGLPPSKEDATGAIGVAKKHRAEQMTDKDILLKDPEVQELLQDDQFLALLEDEDFRALMNNDDVIKFFQMKEVARLVDHPVVFSPKAEFDKVVKSKELKHLLDLTDFVKLSDVDNFTKLMGNPGLGPLLRESSELTNLIQTNEYRQAARIPELAVLFQSPEFVTVYKTPHFRQLVKHPDCANFIRNPQAMKDQNMSFAALADMESFNKLAAMGGIAGIFDRKEIIGLLNLDSFHKISQQPHFFSVAGTMEFLDVSTLPEFPNLAKSADFVHLLNMPQLAEKHNLEGYARLIGDVDLIKFLQRGCDVCPAVLRMPELLRLSGQSQFVGCARHPGMCKLMQVGDLATIERMSQDVMH